MKRIVLAADHGAVDLKDQLRDYLAKKYTNLKIDDLGTYSKESVDYPDIAKRVADQVKNNTETAGILCCGTGIGVSMQANRYKGVRAALVYDEFTAKMAKEHNNANVLCLGGRTTPVDTAKHLVDTWLDASFEGGRHERRIEKLDLP